MTLTNHSIIRNVLGLEETDKRLIYAFMQGAIYCWVKNRKGEWFAVRNLVGGENADWSGTPLEKIYEKHINAGKSNDEAFEAAAKDVGWIVKAILSEDGRTFENDNSGYINSYRWLENA